MRIFFYKVSLGVFSVIGLIAFFWPQVLYSLILLVPLFLIGLKDILQKPQTIRRNFPILGHGRYLMEKIRPEINQYFVESNTDGVPFNRERRSVVYQRSKGVLDTIPFGTQLDVYQPGYEWIHHSLCPTEPLKEDPRVLIGGPQCKKPYSSSVFNVSAMSYGSLSKNAVLSLNKGASLGNFSHNTGEGGITPYHLEHGGDLVWQIGTGYFGCRNQDGNFDANEFQRKAILPTVKMIEVKLSQGAKPGHGGILPAEKLTPEIIAIRGVPAGKDVVSPPTHTAFKTPSELLVFIEKLRSLSGGKPVGFKLCIGDPKEFAGIAKAMVETEILPDFITVDGGEGGTGAAPLEFSNFIGMPLNEGLTIVHQVLTGVGVRDKIKIIAAGKITTGFNVVTKLALGADVCNSARGMMFALGCIQALRCNSNECPTGVATQNPELVHGLDVKDKSRRVANFHRATVRSFLDVIAAAGISHPKEISARKIYRRINSIEYKSFAEIYGSVEPGEFLKTPPRHYSEVWDSATPHAF